MFHHLRGKITDILPGILVIETGGIGWQLLISDKSAARLSKISDDATVYTYMSVKEDAIDLFGFATADELEMFKFLISVSGVGPKASLSILSSFDTDLLSDCILSGDAKTISSAQGIGIKTAQKIILELKDKVLKNTSSIVKAQKKFAVSSDSEAKEAVNALVVLGYSVNLANNAVSQVAQSGMKLQEIIKLALKKIGEESEK